MSVKITRTTTAVVNRCEDCPYFERHPHEPSCAALRNAADAYDNLINRPSGRGIDVRCPFNQGRSY